MSSDSGTAESRLGATASSRVLVSAARNGFIGLAGSAVAAVSGLLLNFVVGRSLGVVAAGAFYVVVAVVTVSGTVARLGADTGLVWALPRLPALGRPQDRHRTLGIALFPVVFLSVVTAGSLFVLAAPIAGRLVDSDQATQMTGLLRVAAPFLALAGPAAVLVAGLRGAGSVAAYSLVQNVVIAAARPVLVLLAAAAGFGLVGAVWAWSLPLLAAVVIASVLLRRMLRRAVSANRVPSFEGRLDVNRTLSSRVIASEFWRFSAARCLAAVVEVAIVWADVLIVSSLTGSREAGIYAAASRFVTTGTLVEGSLRVALAPLLSARLAVRDMPGVTEIYQAATQWIIVLSWPIYIAIGCYAEALLSLFGPGFAEGGPALRLLAGAMLVATATGNSQTVLLMSGRSAWQLANKAVLLLGNVGLNLLLVPRWGMEGAAVAWTATILIDSCVVVLQVRYLVGIRLRPGKLARAMIVGAASFGTVGAAFAFLMPSGFGGMVLGILVAGVLHAAVLMQQRHHFDATTLRAALRRRTVPPPQAASPEGTGT